MAGTLRYITNKPGMDAVTGRFNASVVQTEHADTGWKAEGTINLPIVADKLALRVSGLLEREKGFIDNIDEDGANDQDTQVRPASLARALLPRGPEMRSDGVHMSNSHH